MRKITQLRFENSYAELPPEFRQIKDPVPFEAPRVVAWNESLAEEIGLDPEEKRNPLLAEYMCGKRPIPGSRPLAMRYAGHQFGVCNPRLGDGRALLLGQIRDGENRLRDLHLKGCGTTRFSRGFDGRATLRSCVREYLGSEAMHGLGVPTARALCVVGGEERIERETAEPAGMLLRVAPTHLRFGSFEGFRRPGEKESVRILADYAIALLHPEIPPGTKEGYGLFLRTAAEKTAETIAMWQALGFIHGVMNTDNMSVAGLTIDYGPYEFMEKFRKERVSNSSDHFGRYAYGNQPAIGRWNLEKFAKCLQELAGAGEAARAVDLYGSALSSAYRRLMLRRFGFEKETRESLRFVERTLEALGASEEDYNIFLRGLSGAGSDGSFGGNPGLEKLFRSSPGWRRWLSDYAGELRRNSPPDRERKKLMDSANPRYVLRNHIIETATREALERGDFSEIEKVQKIFENPFSDQPEHRSYAEPSPEWAESIVVSCLS